MSDYSKMATSPPRNKGNEKTPINPAINGMQSNTTGEKYGGPDDTGCVANPTTFDDLTEQQVL